MLNKEKRDLIISMTIGDGCLHELKRTYKGKTTVYAAFTCDHGLKQKDWVELKGYLMSKIFRRAIKIRSGHKGQSVQFSVCAKKLRVYRKRFYPNGKKSIRRLLEWSRNPEQLIAFWLMDDGYCCPSMGKLASGEKKLYGAHFRIFINAASDEDVEFAKEWCKEKLGCSAKVKHIFRKATGNHEPYLVFDQRSSLLLWEKIRGFVLNLSSMRYKFRHIEDFYQRKLLQRTPTQKVDDIVNTYSNIGE